MHFYDFPELAKPLSHEELQLGCPPIDPALLRWIIHANPHYLPQVEATDREIWAEIGVQYFIQKLINIYKNQQPQG